MSIGIEIETTAWPISAADSDHVSSPLPPASAVVSSATTRQIWNATSVSAIPASSFATSTRPRCGTSANVIIAVRCDHSDVTSRIPMTGSRTLAGTRLIAK